jgi:tetraacyldisaccharide 4'-kinase
MSRVLKYVLYPISALYAGIVYCRNLLFDVQLIRLRKLPVPVISIGNLTTGGTGKTPAVVHIAQLLLEEGYKVAILSRGYKRNSKGYVVVSDGIKILADTDRGGDEPVMISHEVPGAVVAVHEKRYRGGKFLIEDYNVDLVILDDGFQHRSLHRDLDIVLINASRIDHIRAHLPSGRLRESLRSLRRADIVVGTKYDDSVSFSSLERLVHRYAPVPVIGAILKPVDYIDVIRNRAVGLESIIDKQAYLFTGIAEPDEFYSTVRYTGGVVKGTHRYRDHYRFKESDVTVLLSEAEAAGADVLVTTEKDAVRLHSFKDLFEKRIPLYALRVSFSMTTDDRNVLKKYIYQCVNKNK